MFTGVLVGQEQIVDWQYDIKTEDGASYLIITGDIKPGWVIYSQDTDPDGPIPTTITLEESDSYSLEGKMIEKSKVISQYSELFEVQVKKFKGQAVFQQQLLNLESGATVSGEIEFMCCDKSRCLPPKVISFEVKG